MQVPSVSPDWWRELFDEVYLKTDFRSVLDGDVTRGEVDGLIQALELQPQEAILDLCGGHGRHALELARRGYGRVLVVDFSLPLLDIGRAQAKKEGLAVTFLRGDARAVPLARESFTAVALLANSIGYGATCQDDLEILREVWRLLKAGGRLFLEVADPEFVRTHLARQSWHEAPEGLVVCRRRWLTEEHLICRELVLCRSRGLVRDRAYQMRLYQPEELRTYLKEVGFSAIRVAPQNEPDSQPQERGSLSRRLAVTAWK
ncbi:MAG: methyltransferase domain-containing protein [Desulfobaccales bacterium]|nr:methyltransferase domain-containing protein [Desulfobaccales bacterium]